MDNNSLKSKKPMAASGSDFAGVQIYEFLPGVVHSRIFVSDRHYYKYVLCHLLV